MKILFVTPEFYNKNGLHPGGLATYTYNAFLNLRMLGNDVYVLQTQNLYGFDKFKEINSNVFYLKESNKYEDFILKNIIKNKFKRTLLWLIQSFKLRKAIAVLDKKYNFDIIHYSSYKAVGFFRYSHVPSVVRISSIQYFWDKFENKHQTIDSRLSNYLELKAIEKADLVIGPSRKFLRFLTSTSKVNNVRWVPTPLLLNSDMNYQTNQISKEIKGGYILYFGTLSKLKGLDNLKSILSLLIDKKLQLVIIGKTNFINETKSCLDELYENLPKGLKLNEVIVYLGVLPRNQLSNYIFNSDLVLIPSLIDNFPNTILEAMLNCGVVVASGRTGAEEIIENGVSGFIFNKTEDLIKYIMLWYKYSPQEKKVFRDRIRKRIDWWLAEIKPIEKLMEAYCLAIEEYKKN